MRNLMQLPALCSPQPPDFPSSWGFPSSSTQHKPPPHSVLRTPSSTAPLPQAELALGHIILRAPPCRPPDSMWQGEIIPQPLGKAAGTPPWKPRTGGMWSGFGARGWQRGWRRWAHGGSWPCSGDEMGHSGGWLGKEKKALSYQLALRKQG